MNRYKFLYYYDGSIRSGHGGSAWQVGVWRNESGDPAAGAHGFHSAPDPLTARGWCSGDVLAEVEVAGEVTESPDESAARSMCIVRAWHWSTLDDVALAIHAAGLVLPQFERVYPTDTRPRQAIDAARTVLTSRVALEPTPSHAFVAAATTTLAVTTAASAAAQVAAAETVTRAAQCAKADTLSEAAAALAAGSAATAAADAATTSTRAVAETLVSLARIAPALVTPLAAREALAAWWRFADAPRWALASIMPPAEPQQLRNTLNAWILAHTAELMPLEGMAA